MGAYAVWYTFRMKHTHVGWGNIRKQTYPKLKGPITCKWLIVGGGIAGLSAAYFLLEAGETDIVIVEKDTIGSGSTGHSAGMLVYEAEHEWWPYYLQTYGRRLTLAYFNAQQDALHLVRQLIIENGIACEYESEDVLFLGDTKKEVGLILRDFKTRTLLQRSSTLYRDEKISKPLKKQNYKIAELARGEVSVNPLLFARGFASYLEKRGVRVFEHTQCTDITDNTITAGGTSIHCQKYLLCRGVAEQNKELKNYLTTIGLTRPLTKHEVAELGLHGAKMFIDNKQGSFYYGKITRNKRLMLGFGDVAFSASKHPAGYIHAPHIRAIETHLQKYAPTLLPLTATWSAPYALSISDVPLVTLQKNSALINGAGTQAASIVAAKYAIARILKKKDPLQKLFNKK
jgi:glycine/D-amino acid oxidase-like deaminating enzyme